MSSSPQANRAGVRLPRSPPRWKQPFSIETDLDVVQKPAGSYSLNSYTFEGQLAAAEAAEEAAVDVVSATGTGPGRHRLLNPFPRFAELVLKLLEAPELVELTLRTYVPMGKAVTKALVAVRPVRDFGLQNMNAATLRMLFAETSSAACRRRQRERTRPSTVPAVELPPDLVRTVVRKLPWKETFGAARGVSKTWRDAVDSVSPPSSYRRRVLEGTLRGSAPERGVTGGRGAAGGGASCPAEDRGLLPSVSWLRENRFDEASGAEVMALLEAGLGWLERESLQEEDLAFRRAAVGDGEIDDDGSEGAARVRWRRLRGFLSGIRAFREERGISCGADRRTAAAATEETGRTAGVHASASPRSRPSSAERDHRWDGWLVLAAAVAFAASEDRSFLCRCALQSVFGTNGLPRAPMIELLCRMHVAVRPPAAKAQPQRGPAGAGFQAASSVSTAEAWDGKGSYRLRHDLLLCIFALEGYCVRFPSAQDTTTEDNDPSTWWLSQSSNLSSQRTFCPDPRWVDESMLTSEQREVVDTEVDVGQTLTIVAYAGTGKTFTLRAVAQRNRTLRILYAAFNRSVAATASSIFSSNTDCKTMSSVSLTGGTFGRVERNTAKVTKAIQAFVGGNTRYSHAKIVLNSIDAFCASSDPDITSEHLKMPPLLSQSPSQSQSRTRRVERPSKGWVLATAKKVWREMHPSPAAASSSTRGPRIPPTFSSCMKAYQLSEPDLSSRYDMVMIDEAQDINPCQADIIERQTKCRVIVVGDPHQAIYGFRGAKDYLKKVKSFKTLYLTQVFRFPNPVASVANTVLLGLKRERRPLLGSLAFPDGPIKVLFEQERHEWLQQDCESKGRFAYIARTNAGLMTEAVAAIGRGDRAAFMDGRAPNLQEVKDLCHMMMGEIGEVKNPDLKEIGSIPALREVLDNGTDDNDIKTIAPLLGMVDDYMSAGKTPHQILADMGVVESMRLGPDSEGPLMILTTVHKVKGLEYDTVVLADDFSFEPVDGSSPLRKSATESANLLYVAVTRAKRQLILNKKLAHQLRSFGMWDSLALQGTTALCPAAGPVPCCTDGCECADAHAVAPAADDPASVNGGAGGVAGSSQRRPRLLYGGSGSGGPLCRACAEGAGENSGAFPYFCSEFVSSSSESSPAAGGGAA